MEASVFLSVLLLRRYFRLLHTLTLQCRNVTVECLHFSSFAEVNVFLHFPIISVSPLAAAGVTVAVEHRPHLVHLVLAFREHIVDCLQYRSVWRQELLSDLEQLD